MTLTAEAIAAMNYNELISVVRETNRPPGGVRSVAEIAGKALLSSDSRVLEVGTSTGITAVELARLVGCQVTAIDINPRSLAEARQRAENAGVADRIVFEERDAVDTGYPDGSFDLVFCGNVTSLIPDRDKALSEYLRLIKPGGFLAAIPMYYIDTPSDRLIADVSEAIQVPIEPLYRDYWLDFFSGQGIEPYHCVDYRFDDIIDAKVDEFVDGILRRPHLADLDPEANATLATQYRKFMHLFRLNLSHMGFTVLLRRREAADFEAELFTSTLVG